MVVYVYELLLKATTLIYSEHKPVFMQEKNTIDNNTLEKKKKSKGNVLVLCAHSDDQALGAGGTLAKLAAEGYDVYTFIFSYGETSHPHMKLSHVATVRVKESKDADSILNGKGVCFLALKDTKIGKDFKEKKMSNKLKRIFLDYKPKKIFTHALDDFHPDHRAVFDIVTSTYDSLHRKNNFTCEIYSFEVWNIWNLKKRSEPALVVDISKYFKQKIKAIHAFKSQISVFTWAYMNNFLYIAIYIKSAFQGLQYKTKFAEVFYKVR